MIFIYTFFNISLCSDQPFGVSPFFTLILNINEFTAYIRNKAEM